MGNKRGLALQCPRVVPFPTPWEEAAGEGPIWLQFHFLRLDINTAIKSNGMQIKELMASCGAWAVSLAEPCRTEHRTASQC